MREKKIDTNDFPVQRRGKKGVHKKKEKVEKKG